MSPNPRLGFLTHSEGKSDTPRIYQETLELFVAPDQLGFDVGWLAEHHFKEVGGRLPSLFPFLAVAGERTKRIRLGTAVILLPYVHPVRIAEDAEDRWCALVDVLPGLRRRIESFSAEQRVNLEQEVIAVIREDEDPALGQINLSSAIVPAVAHRE